MPICFLCNLSLLTINALNFHFTLHHKGEEFPYYKCIELSCNRKFNSWFLLRKHYSSYHKCLSNLSNDNTPSVALENSSISIEQLPDNDLDELIYEVIVEHNTSDENNLQKNIPDDIEIENPFETIENEASLFISKLYANPGLPRNHVQTVINDMSQLLQKFNAISKPLISRCLENVDEQSKKDVNLLFDNLAAPFSNLSTEYRRLKFFSERGFLIKAVDKVIGRRNEDIRVNGILQNVPVEVNVKFIPTRDILKVFLELPNVFDTLYKYINELQSVENDEFFENYVQGESWKRKRSHFDDREIVFPIFLHADDFEINNPLGGHAGIQKLCSVYVTFACIPPEFASSIENVFITLLYQTNDREEFGNAKIFRCLVDELNYLAKTGIIITIEGKEIRVFFVLAGLLSDNLGHNYFLGFSKGFNANYYCRFCKNKKCDCESNKIVSQNLRQKQNYLADLSEGFRNSGIHEDSIWNEVYLFHVYEIFFTDLLHDYDEGILDYGMGNVVHHFIIVKKKFTRDLLNSRMLGFDYSKNGLSNRPPTLTDDNIKNKHLPYSGSEMRNFVLTFSMLVSDRIPFDDEIWQYYLVLRRIYDLVYARRIQKSASDLISSLLREHNSMYIRLFRDTLKPKHHIAEHHSPLVLLESGPFFYFSSNKYESKHSDPKKAAVATKSRHNVLTTLMLKEQLKICYRLIRKEGLVNRLEKGPTIFSENLLDCEEYFSFVRNVPADFEACSLISWVNFKGIRYEVGACLVINNDDDSPAFGKILHVLLNFNKKICFIFHEIETQYFDENVHAFFVNVTDKLSSVRIESLADPFPVILTRVADGNLFVTLKHTL